MRAQKGFTLIELIIVIVVLGILAVTAAPQFINFGSDARASTVNGLKGAMQGAVQVVTAAAALEDELAATGTLDNGTTTAFGAPDATATGIIAATQLDAAAIAAATAPTTDWTFFIDGTDIYVAPGEQFDATVVGDETDFTGSNCFVLYSEPTVVGAAPVITATTSGC